MGMNWAGLVKNGWDWCRVSLRVRSRVTWTWLGCSAVSIAVGKSACRYREEWTSVSVRVRLIK